MSAERESLYSGRKLGPSDDYLSLLNGEINSKEYVERMKADVDARLRWEHVRGPLSFRSMGRFERKLRLLAGSGWNGEHPTGYRWAQRLLHAIERRWWK